MTFTNLSPNTSFRDARIIASFLLCPWKWGSWYTGDAEKRVRHWFREYLGTEYVYTADSGRSALYMGLQVLGIGERDEVIVPGYTCIVVLNAIRAVGATPVLVDIGKDGNIDTQGVSAAITERTKAILAQHTFGLPCDLTVLRRMCDERGFFLIEDCAHALGAHYNEQPVGTVGDIAFFSFGSDKIVSSIRGGLLALNRPEYATIAQEDAQIITKMPQKRLWQHVCSLLLFPPCKVLYRFGGKGILYLLRRWRVSASIFDSEEKDGTRPLWTPTAYPNILAAVLYPQLRALYKQKMRRRIIAGYYLKYLPNELRLSQYQEKTERTYLHLPVRVSDPTAFAAYMKQRGIQVGMDWNGTPIAPKTATQQDVASVHLPVATEISKHLVQLPIHQYITIRKAKRVVRLIQMYISL